MSFCFAGTWTPIITNFSKIGEFYGYFEMFMDEVNPIENGKKEIIGRIEDGSFGKSTFRGEMDEESIHFYKKYDDDAIRRGAVKKEVEFKGTSSNGIFYTGKCYAHDIELPDKSECSFKSPFDLWEVFNPGLN